MSDFQKMMLKAVLENVADVNFCACVVIVTIHNISKIWVF